MKVSGKAGAVGLHRRQVRETERSEQAYESQIAGTERAEVVHAAVVHSEGRVERQVVEVDAELGVVRGRSVQEKLSVNW